MTSEFEESVDWAKSIHRLPPLNPALARRDVVPSLTERRVGQRIRDAHELPRSGICRRRTREPLSLWPIRQRMDVTGPDLQEVCGAESVGVSRCQGGDRLAAGDEGEEGISQRSGRAHARQTAATPSMRSM
jgi:hypothetical protein